MRALFNFLGAFFPGTLLALTLLGGGCAQGGDDIEAQQTEAGGRPGVEEVEEVEAAGGERGAPQPGSPLDLPGAYEDILDVCLFSDPSPGDLVISEIFSNPELSAGGEFIEIYNRSPQRLCLGFLELYVDGRFSGRVRYDEEIGAGEYRLFCKSPLESQNGGLGGCIESEGGFPELRPSGGAAALYYDSATLLDEAPYFESLRGMSMELSIDRLSAIENDDARFWGYAAPPGKNPPDTTSGGFGNSFLYEPPAEVVMSEVETNRAGGDYVEVYAIKEGSLQGLHLWERSSPIFSFDAMALGAGEYVVVHLNGDGGAPKYNSESECPAAECPPYARNFFSRDSGLAATDGIISLRNSQGEILDLLLYANLDGAWTGGTLTQKMLASGEWSFMAGVGEEEASFAFDPSNPASIQAVDLGDNNSKGGWVQGEATPGFGRLAQKGAISFDGCLYRGLAYPALSVSDADANRNPLALDSVDVEVLGGAGGVALSLLETGVDSGVFSTSPLNSLELCPVGACGSGLALLDGDVVTAIYRDLDPALPARARALWAMELNLNLLCNPSFEIHDEGVAEVWEMITPGGFGVVEMGGEFVGSFDGLTSSISGREVVSSCFGVDAARELVVSGSFMTPGVAGETRVAFKVWLFSDSGCGVAASSGFVTQGSSSLAEGGVWERREFRVGEAKLPGDAAFGRVGVRAAYVSGVGSAGSLVFFDRISAEQP